MGNYIVTIVQIWIISVISEMGFDFRMETELRLNQLKPQVDCKKYDKIMKNQVGPRSLGLLAAKF